MDKDDRSMQITADSDIRRGVFADLVLLRRRTR